MEKLKLGVIGLSEGNGHPYSWSAIFNGYDRTYMDKCPFSVIPDYLYKHNYPQDFLNNACVTHIWTQDRKISEHVAKASKIDAVVDNYEDMIGKVDGILLARDDAENHFKMSQCFIEAGVPIYIDKPLAMNSKTAQQILKLEQYEGQIFSCSAMRYAKEVEEFIIQREVVGKINYIDACVMKKWSTYSAHIIDPVLRIIGDQGKLISSNKFHNGSCNVLSVKWESGLISTFSAHLPENSPMIIRVFGENSYKEIHFQDTFYAFRGALSAFVKSILSKKVQIQKQEILDVVNLIEKGM